MENYELQKALEELVHAAMGYAQHQDEHTNRRLNDARTRAYQVALAASKPEPQAHKVLCHAEGERCLGCDHYYGKAPVCVYAKSEPQAQAGEPEVVAEVVSVGTNFATVRPYQQLHGGEKFITLQSHREAMAEQHEIEAQLSGQLEATSRACTEKDAALQACVEAMEYHTEQTRPIYKTEQAIAKAKDALK